MGNSSPLRTSMRNDDVDGMKTILHEAGEGAPDMINEDFTGDCLCERTRNIQSPLHTCVGKRKPEMVELLLKYGADVTSGGRSGMTPLHYAAKNGDVALCRLLVKYNSDPGVEDYDGQKPIHSAAASVWAESNCEHDVLTYFVEELGPAEDVNCTDVDGRTPLHVAAFWGYIGLATYLLEKGADKGVKNNSGKTPLEEASANRKEAMVQLLQGGTGTGDGHGELKTEDVVKQQEEQKEHIDSEQNEQ